MLFRCDVKVAVSCTSVYAGQVKDPTLGVNKLKVASICALLWLGLVVVSDHMYIYDSRSGRLIKTLFQAPNKVLRTTLRKGTHKHSITGCPKQP